MPSTQGLKSSASLPTIAPPALRQPAPSGRLDNFSCIVERYQRLVWSVAYAATGDQALSEDVAQETFLAAWKQQADIRDVANLRAYLVGIARNLALKACRGAGHRIAESSDSSCEEAIDEPSPLESVLIRERVSVAQNALQSIPSASREPFVLFYLENQSVARVAVELDLSQSAVKQRLYRARESLKETVATQLADAVIKNHPGTILAVGIISAIVTHSSTAAAATVSTTVAPSPNVLPTSAAQNAKPLSATTAGAKSAKPLVWAFGAAACAAASVLVFQGTNGDVDAANLPVPATAASQVVTEATTLSVEETAEPASPRDAQLSSTDVQEVYLDESPDAALTGLAHEQPLITGRIRLNVDGADEDRDGHLSEDEVENVRIDGEEALITLIVKNWRDNDRIVSCSSVGIDDYGVYEGGAVYEPGEFREGFLLARKNGVDLNAREWVSSHLVEVFREGQICYSVTSKFRDGVRELRAQSKGEDINWQISVRADDGTWLHLDPPEKLLSDLQDATNEEAVQNIANAWGVSLYAYAYPRASFHAAPTSQKDGFSHLRPEIQRAARAALLSPTYNMGPGAVTVIE